MARGLLIIDIQNDYFPGGAMPLVGPENAAAMASAVLERFRRDGEPVVHVQHIWDEQDATFMRPGTAGVEIHPSVAPIAGEPVISKAYPNSFRETTLLEKLRGARASKVVFAGMMTHMCVDTTVRAAADLGFECLLAGDGCATKALQFSGRQVDAPQVQLAYLAALNGAFAKVQDAAAIAADL